MGEMEGVWEGRRQCGIEGGSEGGNTGIRKKEGEANV